MSGNLERRCRRVLRLLPGWYREQWQEDMVAAFLEGWLTGDPAADEFISRAAGPGFAETASVAGLAVRLHLTGAGAPRRHFAWRQAIRRAVLAVMLAHAVLGFNEFMRTAWSQRLLRLPAPPANLITASPSGAWLTLYCLVAVAWIVVFVTLVLRRYRTAHIVAAMTVLTSLVALLRAPSTRVMPAPFGSWAYWVLLELVPVLAMTAFHRAAPAPPRRPWLLALPVGWLLVCAPLLVVEWTGNFAWVPDLPGLCCLVVALACLAQAPRAWSRQGGDSGVWSLALALLAAVAAANRIATISGFLHDPHMIGVSLVELLILLVAVALVAPDAARAPTATPAPPRHPHPVTA